MPTNGPSHTVRLLSTANLTSRHERLSKSQVFLEDDCARHIKTFPQNWAIMSKQQLDVPRPTIPNKNDENYDQQLDVFNCASLRTPLGSSLKPSGASNIMKLPITRQITQKLQYRHDKAKCESDYSEPMSTWNAVDWLQTLPCDGPKTINN